jgi:hypothetical protein
VSQTIAGLSKLAAARSSACPYALLTRLRVDRDIRLFWRDVGLENVIFGLDARLKRVRGSRTGPAPLPRGSAATESARSSPTDIEAGSKSRTPSRQHQNFFAEAPAAASFNPAEKAEPIRTVRTTGTRFYFDGEHISKLRVLVYVEGCP